VWRLPIRHGVGVSYGVRLQAGGCSLAAAAAAVHFHFFGEVRVSRQISCHVVSRQIKTNTGTIWREHDDEFDTIAIAIDHDVVPYNTMNQSEQP